MAWDAVSTVLVVIRGMPLAATPNRRHGAARVIWQAGYSGLTGVKTGMGYLMRDEDEGLEAVHAGLIHHALPQAGPELPGFPLKLNSIGSFTTCIPFNMPCYTRSTFSVLNAQFVPLYAVISPVGASHLLSTGIMAHPVWQYWLGCKPATICCRQPQAMETGEVSP